jgi:DNA modification methylase
MVGVFREVRRVLRDDGTLWLNMGDSYANDDKWGGATSGKHVVALHGDRGMGRGKVTTGLKPKDLVGMPWRLAFALQADGWYLRADIIWAKPNPMPESVTDRPTKAHEYVFLLSKAARYFYDADAVREPPAESVVARAAYAVGGRKFDASRNDHDMGTRKTFADYAAGRNLRSVWTIPSAPFPDAHFATFPPALASRCIQAGTSERGCCRACGAPWTRQVERSYSRWWNGNNSGTHKGEIPDERKTFASGKRCELAVTTTGWSPSCACEAPPVPCTVLDPFAGSGTVGQVAEQLGRHSVLLELSPTYVQMAVARTAQRGLFTARHGVC